MIVTLNDTTASKIGGAIVEARRTVGSGSGLVHTLICICDSSHFDAAFEAARDAARQHPSRLLMVVTTRSRKDKLCLLYTSPSPRDRTRSRMPSSA